jgi:DNA-binding CsgD family transcriptional regulator
MMSLEGVLAILDVLPNGLLLIDGGGRVLLANEAARRELRAGQTLRVSLEGALQATSDAGSKKLRSAMVAAGRGSRSLFAIGEGEQCVFLATEPLPSRSDGERNFLLLLNRREVCSEVALQLLGKLYGLTLSEREVLAGLLDGQCVQELAARRQRKVSTLRAQIVALRTKFNVGRIDDLTRLAAVLPWTQDARRSGPCISQQSQPSHDEFALEGQVAGSISIRSPAGAEVAVS